MADEVAIAGTGSTAKLRNPLGVVGLSLITLGGVIIVAVSAALGSAA